MRYQLKFSTFMTIYAALSAVFGLGFVFAPGQIFPMFGVEPGAPLKLIAQLFGTVLISLAVLTWLIKNASDSQTRKSIVFALFVGKTLGFIFLFLGQLYGVLNAVGWLGVIIYFLLTLGLAYFQFSESASRGGEPDHSSERPI